MSENILNEIANHSKERVAALNEEMPLKIVKLECGRLKRVKVDEALAGEIPQYKGKFHEAISKPGLSLIAELKKASPSKGVLSKDFSYLSKGVAYEVAGADCISCVTEPKWFLGSEEMVQRIKKEVEIPILRKDFIVDEYQLYQSGIMGADAVLLIAAILDKDTLKHFIDICKCIKIDAVVECHNEDEINMALDAGALIIGVNNRNLEDFTVDKGLANSLRKAVPEDILFIAESGFETAADAKEAAAAGADGILVGEVLIKKDNFMDLIRDMKSAGAQ